MSEVHRLSRRDARRIAVRAQLLDQPRPTDLLEVIRGLSMLQHDPVSAVAPSADLVLWSRLGSTYETYELQDALAEQRVIELLGALRPAEDISLYRAEMEAWPGEEPSFRTAQDQWVQDNEACRLDVLERLRADGPLRLKELPDTTVRPWRSSGWNNNKNLPMLLDCLVLRGEVAVAGREGRQKLYDLATRVYPDDPFPGLEEAQRMRDERRLRSLGIARATGTIVPGEPLSSAWSVSLRWSRMSPASGASTPPSWVAILRAGGPAVTAGPAGDGPQAAGRDLRVRLHARDVQACRQASVGLLRAADPVRRPPRGKARRDG